MPIAPAPAAHSRVWNPTFAGIVLVGAALLASGNSFSGPFVYDDVAAIPDNPTIRQLWPPLTVLSPPNDTGTTVNGRPLLNLSFALNYAIGGTSVAGYHAVNLAIHVLAGLALFGWVRRTLALPALQSLRARFGPGDVTLLPPLASLSSGRFIRSRPHPSPTSPNAPSRKAGSFSCSPFIVSRVPSTHRDRRSGRR